MFSLNTIKNIKYDLPVVESEEEARIGVLDADLLFQGGFWNMNKYLKNTSNVDTVHYYSKVSST